MTVSSFVTRPRFGLRSAGMLLALAGTATAQCPPDAQYLRPVVWAHGGKVLEMVSGDLDLAFVAGGEPTEVGLWSVASATGAWTGTFATVIHPAPIPGFGYLLVYDLHGARLIVTAP